MTSKIALAASMMCACFLSASPWLHESAETRQSAEDAAAKTPEQVTVRESSTVPGPSGTRIPFELVGNIVFLKVRVNGSEPLDFVLDTGSSGTVLDSDQAARLGLQLEKFPALFNVPADVRRAKGVALSLPGLDLVDQTVAVRALDAAQLIHSGRHLYGTLGYGFFSRFVVEIDYAAKVVILFDPKTYRYSGDGDSVPITISSVPFVRAKITAPGTDSLERLLLIDTGSTSTVNYQADQIPAAKIEQDVLDLSNQITAEVTATFCRVKSVELGRFAVENPVVGPTHSFVIPGFPPTTQGIVGGGLLRRFKVIFDYSQRRMILEPNKYFRDPFEFDMSGMMLISDLPNSHAFKLFSVVPKTPAAEAGLRKGDLIETIDGRPADEFDVLQLIDMFRQQERVYRLGVKRQDKQLDVKIKLRRLI